MVLRHCILLNVSLTHDLRPLTRSKGHNEQRWTHDRNFRTGVLDQDKSEHPNSWPICKRAESSPLVTLRDLMINVVKGSVYV